MGRECRELPALAADRRSGAGGGGGVEHDARAGGGEEATAARQVLGVDILESAVNDAEEVGDEDGDLLRFEFKSA